MIRTGRTLHRQQNASSGAPAARRSGGNIVVREAGDCSPYSRVINVADGDGFKLVAFGLCSGRICIDKVVLSTPEMDTIPCCSSRGDMGPEMSTPVILHRKPAISCSGDTLTLDPNLTELTLDGPGHYQLSYECADGVYIEGRRVKTCCGGSK